MARNIMGNVSLESVKRTVEDYFSSETAYTLGGVMSGIGIGELAGNIISEKINTSPEIELGIKVGAKSTGAIVIRQMTKGVGTMNIVGTAIAVGIGVSAVADGVKYVIPKVTGKTVDGYDWLSGMVSTQKYAPTLPGRVDSGGTAMSRLLRKVPVRVTEERPLDIPSLVI